jgi:hypothetical protein
MKSSFPVSMLTKSFSSLSSRHTSKYLLFFLKLVSVNQNILVMVQQLLIASLITSWGKLYLPQVLETQKIYLPQSKN